MNDILTCNEIDLDAISNQLQHLDQSKPSVNSLNQSQRAVIYETEVISKHATETQSEIPAVQFKPQSFTINLNDSDKPLVLQLNNKIETNNNEAINIDDKPRFLVTKGYNAKRKDEIQLPLGSEVCLCEEVAGRSFVVALSKHGKELDRGWVPTFCLQRKEDAVDIQSKEGI